jgi:DNA-binding transcriptional regulator YdaS (Cro superfamily)
MALKTWCDEPGGYGRRSEVARLLGVSPSLVTDWFSEYRSPSADHAFAIQDFLKQQRRKTR